MTFAFAVIAMLVLACLLAWSLLPRGREPDRTVEAPRGDVPRQANLPDMCHETVFEGVRTIVCTAHPGIHAIRLMHSDPTGKPYGSVKAATQALLAKGEPPLMAMNAGMYHADLSPVGLHVEDGVERKALETTGGAGNFYLKPNGVFFVGKDGRPGVMETGAYAAAVPDVRLATQSGPMLVIDGAIHPQFLPDGESRHIRNGVGVRGDGKAVFAITRDPVSLGKFARFFRDEADCPNALFFDGVVSSLATSGGAIIDSGLPAGPVVAVVAIRSLRDTQ